ncbi:MAG: hypothetical protein RML40_07860 [Bacteroidota bacterium]|nr:hypothetical protein [Candidatus Kapabacteria bacterium]MDW8220429.1 hypothetical protein [Bacteroidota bacterium]
MVTPTLSSYQQPMLCKEWLDEVIQRKWFKLFVPETLGGLGLCFHDALRILMESASIHGSLGWAVNLGGAASYFCGFYEPEVARRLFESDNAVIAGSGHPSGEARRVAGGYRLRGIWERCSGAAHATILTFNAKADDGTIRSFTVLPEHVEMQDAWKSFGLKATSTYQITVRDAFVPDELVFDIGTIRFLPQYAVYHIPFDVLARCCLFSTLIGIAQCFVQHMHNDAQYTWLCNDIEQFRLRLLRDAQRVLRFARMFDEPIQSAQSLERHREELRQMVSSASSSIYHQACEIYYKAGISLTSEESLAHWAYRDVIVAVQHFYLR